MREEKKRIPAYIEICFDALYLISVLALGSYFVFSATSRWAVGWGIMALVLGMGDGFHLIPRMVSFFCKDRNRCRLYLGRGKQITSITMTVFYLILWHIGVHFSQGRDFTTFTVLIYAFAILRIVLCLFPQNRWTAEQGSLKWAVYRNIPFLFEGLMVAVLWWELAGLLPSARFLWLAVALSFAFYIPVVLFTHRNPKIGMLMLPKTCMYVWIVAMGLSIF